MEGEVLIEIAFERPAPNLHPGAVVVDTRRGAAEVIDGDPVRVAWPPQLTSSRPLVVACHLAALRREAVLLHAASVSWRGRAVLIVGSPGTGKTSVLLDALGAGADMVGAEWCWVDRSARLWALPQPVRVRPRHLTAISGSKNAVSSASRALLRAARPMPRVVRDRIFVDVPFAAFGRAADAEAGRWKPLAGVLTLAREAVAVTRLEGDDATHALRSATADEMAHSDATAMLRAITANIEVLAAPAHAPATKVDLVGAARQLATNNVA